MRWCGAHRRACKRIRHDFNISVSEVRGETVAADKRYYG